MNTTTATAITTRDEAVAAGRAAYVDPFPGKLGADKVREECGMCENGVYTGPSGFHWERQAITPSGRRISLGDTKWCFHCGGAGYNMVRVSSVRARDRRNAIAVAVRAFEAAEFERTAGARHAAEVAEAHDAAIAEQARRDALVTGFVGEVGTRIRDIAGTVTVSTSFEVDHPRGYGVQTKKMLVITTDAGQAIKTVGTGDTLWGHEKGERVTITGTVKAHGNYRGQDQTTVIRAKIDNPRITAELAARHR